MRILLLMAILIVGFSPDILSQSSSEQKFICPPCGCNSDSKKFDEVGPCPSCGMNMVGEVDPDEGYPYRNIYPEDVCKLDPKEWIFLDVRTEREFNGELGHLKNAIHIYVEELEDRIEELEAYKDSNVLVYCLISIRSMRASEYLVENGFTKVTNMLGGMDLWNDLETERLPCKETTRVFE